jgi:DNA-directed RNA polymerase subunit RPC12/RpoP
MAAQELVECSVCGKQFAADTITSSDDNINEYVCPECQAADAKQMK